MNMKQVCRWLLLIFGAIYEILTWLCVMCFIRVIVERGKFVFIACVLSLSSCDISATHNPPRDELAVSNISLATGASLGFTPCYSN